MTDRREKADRSEYDGGESGEPEQDQKTIHRRFPLSVREAPPSRFNP
jgi:hypothetical protein